METILREIPKPRMRSRAPAKETGIPRAVMPATRKLKKMQRIVSTMAKPTRPFRLSVLSRFLMYTEVSLKAPRETPGGRRLSY